jgi:hypothetical protein
LILVSTGNLEYEQKIGEMSVLKFLCASSAGLLIFLSLSTPALAESSALVAQAQVQPSQESQEEASQIEVSDQELEKFATVIQDLRSIRMESRNEMSQALEEIGLSPEVFREILQAKQDPEAESDASEEELQKFDSATQELSQIQRETQSDMKEAVESQGLEVARFQQILSAVREQPDLQKQVQQIIDNSKQ